MRSLRARIFLPLVLLLFSAALTSAFGKERKMGADSSAASLEIVFCVDLSGSMNGVLSDFRNQYWFIVNMVQAAMPDRELRIGLVGFSRPSFGRENSYVKVLAPISSNLDLAAGALYRLKPSIEKGDQIVSAALRTSIMEMQWSAAANSTKMIFLIGNGMAHSGLHDYVKYAENAKAKNISVHTLYARQKSNYIKEIPGWRRIAGLSGGECMEFSLQLHDSVSIWPSVADTALYPLNLRYNRLMSNTRPDSLEFSRVLFSADSGSFHTSAEAWQDRVYYKSVRQLHSVSKACDESSAVQHEGIQQQLPLKATRECELVRQCRILQSLMREKLDDTAFRNLQKEFAASSSASGDGVLRRCIVQLVYKSAGSAAAVSK